MTTQEIQKQLEIMVDEFNAKLKPLEDENNIVVVLEKKMSSSVLKIQHIAIVKPIQF